MLKRSSNVLYAEVSHLAVFGLIRLEQKYKKSKRFGAVEARERLMENLKEKRDFRASDSVTVAS